MSPNSMKIWIQLPTNKGLQTLPNFQIFKKGLRRLGIIRLRISTTYWNQEAFGGTQFIPSITPILPGPDLANRLYAYILMWAPGQANCGLRPVGPTPRRERSGAKSADRYVPTCNQPGSFSTIPWRWAQFS